MSPQELEKVIDSARRHAAWLLRGERAGHSLQPTALVHEAFLRSRTILDDPVTSPIQFRLALAREMRRVLIDHARRRGALKRGGGEQVAISLDADLGAGSDDLIEVLVLERALSRLAELDPGAADLVVLRFYGGLTEYEVAAHFGKSRGWAQKQWKWVRTWLRRELEGGGAKA